MFKPNSASKLPIGQLTLLVFTVGVGGLLIVSAVKENLGISFLLLCLLSVAGLLLCQHTQKALDDSSLKVLGYYWLIKLLLTFFLLYASWIPILNTESQYDPVRYYYQAGDLARNNFDFGLIHINYIGVLYYYGVIFYLIGHNPIIPALLNSFFTLMACLYLIQMGYKLRIIQQRNDWTLALALLFPEIVWYDSLTSRETLIGSIMVFSLLSFGYYLLNSKSISFLKMFLILVLSVIVVAFVRTSMLVPLFAAILFLMLFVRSEVIPNTLKNPIVFRVVCFAFMTILTVCIYIFVAPTDFTSELLSTLYAVTSAKDNISMSEDVQYSENSISLLFMPNNIFEAILYLPPRIVAYALTPLPNIVDPFVDVMQGKYGSWQIVMTLLSSLFNIFAFPFVLSGLIYAIPHKNNRRSSLIFFIPFWTIFIAVAGGNLIIHERYRVMASLFFVGSFWLSLRVCPNKFIVKFFISWCFFLTFFSLPYIYFKL